ncbi:imidazolonepropionase [Cyclonatronum proteinivorum]|uniref:Imidazolonepropionase n=1 Tax=Cyclonatronum proteinivorum TaxID=1457365 RepID=A0A345UG71_9BACT|nr:imidazolonepropionase [Cyclonatronum proteinivorum]AXI99472.1 imidazolonepropionase [Cyclonatronum proteinivorum]
MPVLKNIGILYTCAAEGGQADIHPVKYAALVWERDKILWTGPEANLPEPYHKLESLDAGGKMVIPGLVECHTHLAFGGWRADEFELRSLGRPYLEIAKSGGGILSSVRATREASPEELLNKCLGHLQEMKALGITTVECKSGYGLNRDDELKVLQVYRELDRMQPLDIVSTFLGAHMVPPEYAGRREAYVAFLVEEMLPLIADAQLARFCDIFIEETAFTIDEAYTILANAIDYGFMLKLHADQLSPGGGAELAAQLGAVSADHLEYISEAGIQAMKNADVVAVSLPLASFYLRQPAIPARKLIEAGVSVAVSTDFNPGSAPSFHLPAAMTMACTLQHMSPAEVLKGATFYAAKALRMQDDIGSLEPGKRADFALIDAPSVNHWLYHLRPNACTASWKDGIQIYGQSI